ncbi:tetratricopeptide repeat protein [Pseudoxanthomonas sacheonensis]|uniref:tetratricopeptide repeat protein n=1 Tax=Pseudoxanthomonas sacheonensis TaxID=443615 RepID=UPI0013D89952|nr:tetratricopeptide repeat protein [Pseudoxanthomonas sacheonensis]KAF1709068.1 adenylate cyclase [Pseudoxanthomonas sacheonensis]
MQEKIIQALRSNAAEEAVTYAREWIHQSPDDAQAHRWLAVASQQRGDHSDALRSIERAIELAPENDALQLVRANLLIAGRQWEEANAALSKASNLNPNQLGAYLMQAQLALGRGDLDEAERLNRLASRVAPDHPQLAVVEGMLALQRGNVDAGLKRVSAALQQAPEDVQLRYVLGFLYLRKQLWAFAEQAFRGVVDQLPDARNLRALIADLVNRQGRPAEAAAELAPLLADPATATPAVKRAAGLLHMRAGQAEQALPLLRGAFAARPADLPTLQGLVAAWRALGLENDARASLEAALGTTTDAADLWRARLAFAPDAESRRAVIERWTAAMPQSMLPLEILLKQQQQAGDPAAAATAARVLRLDPSHAEARLQILDGLMDQDPGVAIAQIETWLLTAVDSSERRFLLGLLGLSHEQAGAPAKAVAAWTRMQAELVPQLVPLPPLSAPRMAWPELAPQTEDAPKVMFLWGAPGSGVERLAAVMGAVGDPFRSDRFGPQPPQDGFQSYSVIDGLLSGSVSGEEVAERWRQALPSRQLTSGDIFDWLPWWDNALLIALRPYVREGMLVMAIRDPRDMLLDWLAFGSAAPFAMPSVPAAAAWLAGSLSQVAALFENQWYPNRVIRTDAIGNDPRAAADQMGEVLRMQMPAPASVGPAHFPAGHWRHYRQALGDAFAVLAPIAQRMGYPET